MKVPCHADCWLCGNHLYWFNVLFPYRTWEVRMSDLESAKQESEEKEDTDPRECEESEVKDY